MDLGKGVEVYRRRITTRRQIAMKRPWIDRLVRALVPVAVLSALWAAAGAPLYQGL